MSATAAGAPAVDVAVAALRERVREAIGRRASLRVTGAGTWLDAGRPVRAAEPLAVGALRGVVDYVPGDFTITVRAGTPLGGLAETLAAERQWVALDPVGDPAGTVGATVATASAGALAHAFGAPRDNVLGLEVVTGEGKVVRAGGRVVKNVAGFDLVRLFAGSWGTLGAITEVTLRTRALPEDDETWALEAPAAPDALAALLAALRRAPVAPWAAELLDPAAARAAGAGDAPVLLVRLAGNAASVAAQRDALARLAPARPVPADAWARLRAPEAPGAAVVRLSGPASRLAHECWAPAREIAARAPGAALTAAVGRGVVRAVVPDAREGAGREAARALLALPCRVVAERLPADAWRALPSPLAEPLMRRVKETFDPMHILNPGILGEASL